MQCGRWPGPGQNRAGRRSTHSSRPGGGTERPIARFLRATGRLSAQGQAEVAGGVAGRGGSTAGERGTAVGMGSVLIQISPTESDAQVAEAEANAAQIEARLGLTSS